MKLLVVAVLALALAVNAEIVEFPFDYQIGDGEQYEGYAAYDSDRVGPDGMPSMLISHDFWGIDDSDRFWARHWAEQGYFAFAGDVYSKFVRPTNTQQASGNATLLRSNPVMHRNRAQGAYRTMLSFSQVNPALGSGVTGYCFGVATAFELVRSQPQPQLRAAAGFHGGLADLMGTLAPGLPNEFDRDVFIQYHGAGDDNGVSDENLAQFESNLRAMNLERWSVHQYRPAAHGFASPAGAVYNELVATSSHFTLFKALELMFDSVKLNADVEMSVPKDIAKHQKPVKYHYERKWEVVEGKDGIFYVE